MKKGRRQWIWLALGAVIIALIFYNLRRSPEWRNFRWERFWASIVDARMGLLVWALAAVFSTYAVRAYRWQCFMSTIKKASLWVLFVGQVLGFSSIYLIGRPGEFVRPAFIAKKENVPISAMVAVLVVERMFDSLFLAVLLAAWLFFEHVGPSTAHGQHILATVHWAGDVLFALMGLMVLALVLFRLHSQGVTEWILEALHYLPPRGRGALRHFLHSFSEGLGVIRDWRELAKSVASTVVLWVLNTMVFWLVFRALRGETQNLPWLAAAMTLFCAALGLVIQFPGIGGGYQVGIILALTGIFNVSAEKATSAAILLWIIMSVPCLGLGLTLLIREGLTFKKLEALAEEERALAAVEEEDVK